MSNKYPGGIITSGANAGYSVAFDGSGDALTYPNNTAFAFGTGAFTIEFWINGPSNDNTFILGGRSAIGTMHITTGGTSTGTTVSCLRYVGSSTITTSSTLITNNSWNHCAIVRDGSSNITLYVNGVSAGTGTDTTNYTTTSGTWYIGQNDLGNSNYLQGNLSNLRIVKGTALYTTTFRPPTQLLNVTNTSLLTCNSPAIVDQSSNAFTITANGNAAVSTFTPFVGTQLVPNPNTLANTQGVWSISDAAYWMSQNKWPMPPNYPLQSLRFNRADSAYMSRTLTSNGNRQLWTFSVWLKRSGLGTQQTIIGTSASSTIDWSQLVINSSDQLEYIEYSTTDTARRVTTQVLRDVSAWYHIVCVWDSSNATANNRILLYINGQAVTAFSTTINPSLGASSYINSTSYNPFNLGRLVFSNAGTNHFDGYMSNITFVDGQALTPSSFGANDPNTGVWSPVPYSGTYGTNGFRLSFQDNTGTTATTLGRDYSGNGNNWTPNNFSVAAGSGNDSLTDGPTNWGIDYGNGGEVRGNYCTLNPLKIGANATLANGNLDFSSSTAAGFNVVLGTLGMSSGKWYWEITATSSASNGFGIATDQVSLSNYLGSDANGWMYYQSALKYNNGSSSAYGASFTTNDVIGFAFDADAGSITAYKNGVSQGVMYSGLAAGTYFPAVSDAGATTVSSTANFGQRPFAYPAPSGFKVLCTTNLPIPTVGATSTTQADDYFNAVAYSGNSSTQTITTGFQPDLVWIKSRSTADVHTLQNVISGARYYLISNSTAAEATQPDSDGVSSFTSTGFSLGFTDSDAWNKTGNTYISWSWKANGAGSSNTAGSISSTVSANQTAGISIVAYTGTGSNATVGHGIGVAPSMIIVKRRGAADTWRVYHSALGNTKFLNLNETAAAGTASTVWNNTSPTSTVFSIGTDSAVNSSSAGNTFVAYCFAEIAGFSKFGSYTGNASTDGPFIFTGFRPRFVFVKRTDTTGDWVIHDTARSPYNQANAVLYPNLSNAEDTSFNQIDILSNGFKCRSTNTNTNASGGTYIFMAFAESPFNYSRAR